MKKLKCGTDDEELRHIEQQLYGIDCGMDAAELKDAVSQFKHLPDSKKKEIIDVVLDRKLYEEDIINRYGISRPTMYRWIEKGKLPPFRHEAGHKNYLYQSEADERIRAYESSTH